MANQDSLRPMQRCEIVPLAERQFQFLIDGIERTRWHFGSNAPRPYLYPIVGPSGKSLTRMGHPGAPDHDHHRSMWFAHHDMLGIDFWSDNTTARIEQAQWYAISEDDESATLAVQLVWIDGHDPQPLLKQDLIMSLSPAAEYEEPDGNHERVRQDWLLELQSDFRSEAEGMAFRKSNFGVVALRVAKSLSVVFGNGTITGANGFPGEADLFGRPNRWIDYSGPIVVENGRHVIEGLALIDHRDNPGHGTDPHASWHVRDDGWIGPSISRHSDTELPRGESLRCRYMLYVHSSGCDPARINVIADEFDETPPFSIRPGRKAHHRHEVMRTG